MKFSRLLSWRPSYRDVFQLSRAFPSSIFTRSVLCDLRQLLIHLLSHVHDVSGLMRPTGHKVQLGGLGSCDRYSWVNRVPDSRRMSKELLVATEV